MTKEWLLLVLTSFTSFLFFVAILQMLFFSNKNLDKRMKHYLSMKHKKKISRKNFNVILQIQLSKQKIKQKVLTRGKNKKLEVELSRAGVPLKPEEYVLFHWISVALCAGLLFLITGQWFFIFVGGLLGAILPKFWLKQKQKRKMTQFNEQLPDMLTTIVGSLRAGFSFPQAMTTVVEEANAPMKEEMDTALREMKYGSSLEVAMNNLYERMPSEDLELMIQAIVIQRQVGGNLATVLDKIVQTIRDRNRIQRNISTLTAQGRLSGIVIGLLPIILGFVLYFIEPAYIGSLFSHPIGLLMVAAGCISFIIGFVMIRKLTTIEV